MIRKRTFLIWTRKSRQWRETMIEAKRKCDLASILKLRGVTYYGPDSLSRRSRRGAGRGGLG